MAMREGLLDQLTVLLPAQLDLLVVMLSAPPSVLSGPQAPLATRAIELIRWAEQQGRVDDLARLLAQQLIPSGHRPSPARLVWLGSDSDISLAMQLDRLLRVLEKQGMLSVWSPRQITPGDDLRRATAQKLEQADVILLLVSADYLASASASEWTRLALQQAERRRARVLPVLLRPALLPPDIQLLTVLPRDRRPVTMWEDRDDALLDVVEGVQNILAYGITTQTDPSPRSAVEPTPEPARRSEPPPPSPRATAPIPAAPIALDRIFRTDGPPEITFVAPTQFDDLRRELAVMGRGLIVEGPSKVGKSTAIKKALAQQAPRLVERWFDGKLLSARDPVQSVVTDLTDLLDRMVMGGFSGHILVDDAHYVDDTLKRRLAMRMKSLADQERPAAKVTLIGINPVGSSLPQLVPDLAGRFQIVRMDRQPDAKIAELVVRGEQEARVRFLGRDGIINESEGSFYIAQSLCYRLASKVSPWPPAGVVEIDVGPEGVMDDVREHLRARYHDQLRDLAAHDQAPPPRGATLVLLWLLAKSKNGDLSIQEAIHRYPALTACFEWLRASNLQALFDARPDVKDLFYYNRGAGTLSIEDPQLKFYLKRLDWAELAAASGHVSVQIHPIDGPLFSSPRVEPPDSDPSPRRGHQPPPAEPRAVHILHLSDLHIATEAQSTLWYSQLAADLREQACNRLEALAVSGDIANLSTPQEYQAARLFLEQLMAGFGLTPKQVVLVPGNHDLNWALSQDAYSIHKRSRYHGPLADGAYIEHGAEIVEVRDDDAYKLRFQHFAELYRQVKGEEYPLDPDQQATVHTLPEHGLLFLGLNSAHAIDHHFRDRAGVNPTAVARALLELGPPAGLRIAVWHHPVQSASEDRIHDTGFLQRLAVAGFRVGLHGHIHRSDNQIYRYDMSAGGRRLDLVAGGTFGAPAREWAPGYPLQYNLLRLTGDRLVVETRRREETNGAWAPDARWLHGKGADPLPRYNIEL